MSRTCDYIRKEYTVAEVAYMAATIDQKGTFIISFNRDKNGDKHFQTRLTVCSMHESISNWLINTFGGSIELDTRLLANIEPITDTTIRPFTLKKPINEWYACSDRLLHICEIIRPYLVIKKRQAEIMIEMRNTFNGEQNIKGKQYTQAIGKKTLELREQLMEELKLLHAKPH